MGSIFRFKAFEVDQGNCAMKINTDGVLLGANANLPTASHILDIGTGTGVIAMMLAQSHPHAHIDAVEIDREACSQAAANFKASPFADRLHSIAGPFQEMVPSTLYDLIVSNPPFYTNSLHNPDPRKKLAKHTDNQFFEDMLLFVSHQLSSAGEFHCILPAALADSLVADMLPSKELYLQQEISIASYPDGDIIRKLLQIGRVERVPQRQVLHIYRDKGEYSDAYKQLLAPYFLAF